MESSCNRSPNSNMQSSGSTHLSTRLPFPLNLPSHQFVAVISPPSPILCQLWDIQRCQRQLVDAREHLQSRAGTPAARPPPWPRIPFKNGRASAAEAGTRLDIDSPMQAHLCRGAAQPSICSFRCAGRLGHLGKLEVLQTLWQVASIGLQLWNEQRIVTTPEINHEGCRLSKAWTL